MPFTLFQWRKCPSSSTCYGLFFRFLNGSGNLGSSDVYIGFLMVDDSSSVWTSFYECFALKSVGLALMIPIVLDTKSAWYSVIIGENEPWASFLPFLTQLPSFSVILVSFFSARFLCGSFSFDFFSRNRPFNKF